MELTRQELLFLFWKIDEKINEIEFEHLDDSYQELIKSIHFKLDNMTTDD